MAPELLENRPCGGRYGDIVQAIGHTPLVELKRLSPRPGVRIWAKLESHNPTGSVKDRVARALIEDAEDKGLIGPGQTILEPTSGNTGISLAMICGRKGHKVKVVMPDNVTQERTQLLQMYGDRIKIVAAEPMQGEPVQGLRSLEDGFIPPIIDLALLDRKIFVTNSDAITFTRKLLDEERIFAGVSSGAIARVAVRIAGELDEGNVVFVVADDGWKYLSSGLYTRPLEEIENLDSTVWW
jgi:cysteine synthase